MPAHHITDLKIENFRGFKSLELNGLKSVNLIVGENNTGKTSLLEALVLGSGAIPAYGFCSSEYQYATLLRDEISSTEAFFRWMKRDESTNPILIACKGQSITTFVYQGEDPDKTYEISPALPFQNKTGLKIGIKRGQVGQVNVMRSRNANMSELVTIVGKALRKNDGESVLFRVLSQVDSRYQRTRIDPIQLNVVTVSVGLGHSELIPLEQTGQGFFRVVQILSLLIANEAKICIIDEIDNGIHYSALPQLWRGIAELSKQLNVQIFATTHSRDCILAAHDVMHCEDKKDEIDFGVVQLYRHKGEIAGRILDEEHVAMAVKTDTDLR